MYLQRQISVQLCEGEKETAAEGYRFPYRLVDVLPKYVLNVGDGAISSGYFELGTGDTLTLPLPEEAAATDYVSVILRSRTRVRVEVTYNSLPTSVFLMEGTDSTDEGEHPGLLMFQGKIVSIQVTIPTGEVASLLEYFMFKVPDLDIAASYQIGDRAIGYVP